MSEQTTTTTASPGLWAVLDVNAKGKKRLHEPAAGVVYALDAYERVYMPRAHAMVFMRDPAFMVFDEDGNLQAALPPTEAAGERNVTTLAPEECIARYDELTTTALLARVAIRPGGSSVPPDAPRGQLIAFLTSVGVRQDQGAGQKPRPSSLTADPVIGDDNPALGRLPSTDDMLRDVPTAGGGVELEADPLQGG